MNQEPYAGKSLFQLSFFKYKSPCGVLSNRNKDLFNSILLLI